MLVCYINISLKLLQNLKSNLHIIKILCIIHLKNNNMIKKLHEIILNTLCKKLFKMYRTKSTRDLNITKLVLLTNIIEILI